ncbi:MAG: FtsX-like permease family protein [Nitrospirota bacterium]|nr:FtsX-like permease family protein [Nitrospirota bacterium]
MKRWIDKQKNIIDFTLSSLLRRKGKNTALFLVYTLIVFLLASVMFYTYALKKEAALILQNAPDIVVQRTVAGRHDLMPVKYVEEMRKIRGVNTASPRLWGYYYDPRSRANFTLMVSESHPLPAGDIIIGSGISRSLRAFRGDMMTFRTHDGDLLTLQVSDILSTESELVSADIILMAEEDFRDLSGMAKEYATDLTLRVRNQEELRTIAGKIADLLPGMRPIIKDEMLRTYDSVFDWRSGMVVLMIFSSVLAFIIFAWDKASGLSAEERKEIGILKAIGWETSDVIVMKFWEGAVISLTSFLTGMVLAYIHIFFTPAPLFEGALKGWSVLYPSFRLTPFINPYQIATLFFLTVVPYTVATIVPSWRAATVDPDSIMRS